MQLYRGLNSLQDWLYVGSGVALLAALHLLVYPIFRDKNTVDRSIMVSTIVNKVLCFTIMVLQACGALDLGSAIRSMRSFFLATYLHDTLVLLVKLKDLQPWFGGPFLFHHSLTLIMWVPYTALWGSNPDLIHFRALGIWVMESLVANFMNLYRLTYGIPAWWDAARLPRLLGLLVPVIASFAYAFSEMRLSIFGWTFPTFYVAAVGLIMPAYNLYEQYKSWKERRLQLAALAAKGTGSRSMRMLSIRKSTLELQRPKSTDLAANVEAGKDDFIENDIEGLDHVLVSGFFGFDLVASFIAPEKDAVAL